MLSSRCHLGTALALLLALLPQTATAQGKQPTAAGPSIPAWVRAAPADTVAMESPQLSARLLTAAGAAAIGAGLGFFASQVARGDWDEGPGGSRVDRGLWAAVGGGLGFAVGLRFPLGGAGAPSVPRNVLPQGRFRLGADEIRDAGVPTAYEAIKLLRPEWLTLRGTQVWRQAAPGTTGSDPARAAPTDMAPLDGNPLPVYLDDQPLGSIDALTTVTAEHVGAIYFLDASQATVRWGAGHGRGAILVVTAG
jgi:hypothetical protein